MGKHKGKRSHTKHVFVQKKYRDALFRRIFNEKPVLLELYNALNQTDYDDADELIFYTIDDVIYLGYKNDVSFIVRGTLNLYEHQSTLNPNMPIRGLIYFGKQYESYIKQNNLNIYGKKLLSLPFPQFVIFYNQRRKLHGETQRKTQSHKTCFCAEEVPGCLIPQNF